MSEETLFILKAGVDCIKGILPYFLLAIYPTLKTLEFIERWIYE